MSFIKDIKRLANETSMTNREIANELGCSRRTVRRVAGKDRYRGVGSLSNGPAIRVPKVLILDVETAPMEIYVWGLFKQHPTIEQISKDWCLLSWAAKWLNEPSVMSARINAVKAYERDDSSILKELWDLLEEADIVIAHNAKKFDIRKINARFIQHGYGPTSPFQVIDTLIETRKMMAPASWKLKYLNEFLNVSQKKDDSNYGMWVRAVNGDDSAIEEMLVYNKQDVVALEDLYMRIRPWIKSHPNMALYMETDYEVCPTCGNDDLDWNGNYVTPAGKFRSFRCKNCGAIGRSRFSSLTKDERLNLCISVAR